MNIKGVKHFIVADGRGFSGHINKKTKIRMTTKKIRSIEEKSVIK